LTHMVFKDKLTHMGQIIFISQPKKPTGANLRKKNIDKNDCIF